MRQDEPDALEWSQDDDEEWRSPPTIFIVIEARGVAGAQIADIQRRFDKKLASRSAPHLTLTGSSGVGPLPGSLAPAALRDALAPIAASVRPFSVSLGRPERFMQTNTVVLPIEPYGPIRELHDLVARSGLPFQPAKFTFTPHVTLNYFASLTPDQFARLLKERVAEPLVIDHMLCSLAREPERPSRLFELPLSA
jgi:2'-5' RNA ligase